MASRPSSPATGSNHGDEQPSPQPSSRPSSQISHHSNVEGSGEPPRPASPEAGATKQKLGSPVVLPQDASASEDAPERTSTDRHSSSQHAPSPSPSLPSPSSLALGDAPPLAGDVHPMTAVPLSGPSTPPRSTPVGSPHLQQSPSSPAFAEAMRRRSRADRSSFLLSHAARQSEHRQSVDAGNSKLKEDFERLRAAATHARSASGGDASGSSPRSSVAYLQRAASRSRRHSATSRASRRSHADDGSDGGRAIREEEDELVDEPIDTSGTEDVDWSFWGEVMNGGSSRYRLLLLTARLTVRILSAHPDYQHVARSDPTKLSKAIQAGIPDVIRGQIWQLSTCGDGRFKRGIARA